MIVPRFRFGPADPAGVPRLPLGDGWQCRADPYGGAGRAAVDRDGIAGLLGDPQAHAARRGGRWPVAAPEVPAGGKSGTLIADFAGEVIVLPQAQLAAAAAVPDRVGHHLVDRRDEVDCLLGAKSAMPGGGVNLTADIGEPVDVELRYEQ